MRFTCKECGVERDESEFYRNPTYKCGFAVNQCRPCRVAYRERHKIRDEVRRQVWRENNPDAIKASNARYYAEHRVESNERVKKWRSENPTKARLIEMRKYERRKIDGTLQAYRKEYEKRLLSDPTYLNKLRARRAARYAVKTGALQKKPCEVCGDEKVEIHHHKGYEQSHWLDVQWLCRKHHRGAHGKVAWDGGKEQQGG